MDRRVRQPAVLLALGVLAATTWISSPVSAGLGDWCNGKRVTVKGNRGTMGDDVMFGGGTTRRGRPVKVKGFAGNDTICASISDEDPGETIVYAGSGNDWVEVCCEFSSFDVWGERGRDRLEAPYGSGAFLIGGPDSDTLVGFGTTARAVFWNVGPVTVDFRTHRVATTSGTDKLVNIDAVLGSERDDVIRGAAGSQYIHGGKGEDRILGGGGRDDINGGRGNDEIEGRAGNDRLFGARGTDSIAGGGGTDTLWFEPENPSLEWFPFGYVIRERVFFDAYPYAELLDGVNVDLSQDLASFAGARYAVTAVENVLGSVGDDIIVGDDRANLLDGGSDIHGADGGDDSLFGLSGDDDLVSIFGSDYFDGGDGTDRCQNKTELGAGDDADTKENCETE